MASSNSQSGNILIYILGAIFLMGLLVLALRGSSSPGSGIDEENLLIRVSEVQQYGLELERAVGYVFANGYSETDIRFAHPDANVAYGLITDDPERQVFAREGGGAQYREPPNGIQVIATDWHFSGANQVIGIGTTIPSASDRELIAFLPNVTKNFCIAVNEKNDITNVSGDPPQDDGAVTLTIPFVGVFTANSGVSDTATQYLTGKSEGCFEGDTTPAAGTYHYYRVLLAR